MVIAFYLPDRTLADNEPTTVQFDIPDSDFQIDFQGGQRVWVIRDFTLTLDD